MGRNRQRDRMTVLMLGDGTEDRTAVQHHSMHTGEDLERNRPHDLNFNPLDCHPSLYVTAAFSTSVSTRICAKRQYG